MNKCMSLKPPRLAAQVIGVPHTVTQNDHALNNSAQLLPIKLQVMTLNKVKRTKMFEKDTTPVCPVTTCVCETRTKSCSTLCERAKNCQHMRVSWQGERCSQKSKTCADAWTRWTTTNKWIKDFSLVRKGSNAQKLNHKDGNRGHKKSQMSKVCERHRQPLLRQVPHNLKIYDFGEEYNVLNRSLGVLKVKP